MSATPAVQNPPDAYESSQIVAQYLVFHYGSPELRMPWDFGPREMKTFPDACVDFLREVGHPPPGRALDVGCAVGAASFILSSFCEEVVGVDYSRAFIEVAESLREQHQISRQLDSCGEPPQSATFTIPTDARPERIRFAMGDAHALSGVKGPFSIVLACNLLCRLHHPDRFLNQLPQLMQPGALLLITTPHTWMEQFTAREFWLPEGTDPEAGPLHAIQKCLAPHFTNLACRDLPFVIREHRRKFQWSVAQASLWQRF